MERTESTEKNAYWKSSWKELEAKMKEKIGRKWVIESGWKDQFINSTKDRLAHVKNLGDYRALKEMFDDTNTNLDIYENSKEVDVDSLPSKWEPKEGKIRKLDFDQYCYYGCDVCLNPIYKIGFYLCSICYGGDYAECKTCHNKKKEMNKPHPHTFTMFELNFGIFNNNPTIRQRNILSFDGGGIRGYTSIALFETFLNLAMTHFAEEMNQINSVIEANMKVDSSFKYGNEFKLKLYEELTEVTLTEEEESLAKNEEKKETMLNKKRLDIFTKHLLRRKFHLICGTSIGGIISIMLALEIPFSAIKNLFKTRARDMFQKNKFKKRFLSPGGLFSKTKYKSEGVIQVFEETIRTYRPDLVKDKEPNQLTFEDLELPCGITSYDMVSGQILWVSTQFAECKEFLLLDAILATSAAPTYFPSHTFTYPSGQNKVNITPREYVCVDGGIWGNDPRTYALFIERMINAHYLHTHYQCLSFGTGHFYSFDKEYKHLQSKLGWVVRNNDIFDVMLESTTNATEKMCNYINLSGLVMTTKIQVELPKELAYTPDSSFVAVQKQNIKDHFEGEEMQGVYEEAMKLLYIMGQNLESKDVHDTTYDEAERKARVRKELFFSVKARSSRLYDILGLNIEKMNTKKNKK